MTKTTTKKQPSAQVEPAQKASALKVANEAKRAQPDWLCRRSLSPPRETETPSAPERPRTSDRSQGPPWLLDRHQVCAFHLLVFHRTLPDLQRMKLCHSVAASSASRSVFLWCD